MYPYTIGNNDTITIHVNGNVLSVRVDDPFYRELLQALKEKRWEDIPVLVDRAKSVELSSKGQFKVVDGKVYCVDFNGDDFEVPSVLGEEIIKYYKLGLDYDRLVLFARRLQQNPSYHSVQQLFSWLKKTNLTITEEGKFIAYRGVMQVSNRNLELVEQGLRGTADLVDWYSKSFDNSVGKTVSMKRNQVDEDPKRSCSKGLHVATYDYAHKFYIGGAGGYKEDGVVVFVEVCPSHVVAVPDLETHKMRVSEFKVIGISDAPFDAPHWRDPELERDTNPGFVRDPFDYSWDEYQDEDEDEDEDEDLQALKEWEDFHNT